MNVTENQLSMMKHALGLNYKNKPYRNRFFTIESDPEWNDLVEKGLAIKGPGQPNNDSHVYFWLTKTGAELVYGKPMTELFYNDL